MSVSSSCSICQAGLYSNVSGSTACCQCQAATYSSVSAYSVCVQCQAGFYSNVSGVSVSSSCSKCQVGFYSNVSASTPCSQRQAGTYSSVSAAVSLLCVQPVPDWLLFKHHWSVCPSGILPLVPFQKNPFHWPNLRPWILLIDLVKCKLRKSTMGSAIISARRVTYRSWNDHDNFERVNIGNRSVKMSFTLHVFYFDSSNTE